MLGVFGGMLTGCLIFLRMRLLGMFRSILLSLRMLFRMVLLLRLAILLLGFPIHFSPVYFSGSVCFGRPIRLILGSCVLWLSRETLGLSCASWTVLHCLTRTCRPFHCGASRLPVIHGCKLRAIGTRV